MAESKVRVMSTGGVIVGKWVTLPGPMGVEMFEPLAEQPSEDVAVDVNKVINWLKARGEEGDFALVRGYAKSIRVGKITKTTIEAV